MLTALRRMMVTGLCLIGVVGAITMRASTRPYPTSPNLHPTLPNLHPTLPNLHSTQPNPTPNPFQAKPSDVAALYKLHCQMCHGANGKAPLPEMAFVEREWKHGTASAEMAKVITEGVTGTPMMPFKGKLTPEQITALAKHVRAFDTRLKPEKR